MVGGSIKKLRIKMTYPPDATLHESWVTHKGFTACEKLLGEFDIEVVGRIPEEIFRKMYPETKAGYVDFFESDLFSRKITEDEIEEAEKYAGVPFSSLIFANQRRWGWVNRKGLDEKLARYVLRWKELLGQTDILVSYLENLFFLNLGESAAEHMGIPVIKISGPAGITKDSIILWDKNCTPIFYKKEYAAENLNAMLDRVKGQKKIIRLDRKIAPSMEKFAKKVPKIPERIRTLAKGRRKLVDADMPALPSKYMKLVSMSLRHLVYPGMHSIFFEQPREGEKFFLFPLHYEWEAQIAYREPFLNQIELAKKISKSLPENTFLYVKIHPHYRNADQPLGGMYELRKERNIRLITPDASTIELIRRSVGVIVVNSTVGYEAIALEKPLIVLGHEAYREVGIEIKDINELARAIMSVYTGKYHVDSKKYEEFLKKFTAHVITTENPEEVADELRSAISWIVSK